MNLRKIIRTTGRAIELVGAVTESYQTSVWYEKGETPMKWGVFCRRWFSAVANNALHGCKFMHKMKKVGNGRVICSWGVGDDVTGETIIDINHNGCVTIREHGWLHSGESIERVTKFRIPTTLADILLAD